MSRPFLFLLLALPAAAATITGNENGGPPISNPPYTVALTPQTVQHIGTADPTDNGLYTADMKVINDAFSNFTTTKGAADAPGTFNILQYDPFALVEGGGANFSVLYDDGLADGATNYDWIQIAHCHNWGDCGNSTKVDVQTGSKFPFYYTLPKLPTFKVSSFSSLQNTDAIWDNKKDYPDQKIQSPAGGGNVPKGGNLLFVDQPFCQWTCADADNTAWIYFDLYLVTWTWNNNVTAPTGTVTLLDGLRYGVEITKDPQTYINVGSVPEPGTYALIGGGLLALALLRKLRPQPAPATSRPRRALPTKES